MLKADLVSTGHGVFWWYTKVGLGAVLVAGIVARFGFNVKLHTLSVPIGLGQALVCLGVGIYFYHYLILKRRFKRLSSPDQLEHGSGLYRWVRHPMYFGDLIYYTGMALMWPGWPAFLIWSCAAVAVHQQAKEEDNWCAKQFPQEHEEWKARSHLLVPGLL